MLSNGDLPMRQQSTFHAASALVGMTALGAVAVLGWVEPISADPQSKPTLTLAPYVLSNSDLRLGQGGAKAYRPWFENGAWTGDLIEYNISKEGVRCTTVVPGSYPPNNSGNLEQCPPLNWSARGSFPDKIESGGTLIDDPAATTYWRNERQLFIYHSSKPNNRAPFWWGPDTLNADQKWALDEGTCGPIVAGVCSNPEIDQNDAQASTILNYIRGDRSEERDKPGGIFRLRYSILGPIINSRPAFVPIGDDGVVVVGANDGIIHAFDASDGSELFGYVPSVFFPRLQSLADSPYRFSYFADGELRSREIEPGRHIVTGGFGAGGKGLFALELNSINPGSPKFLFELSGTQGAHVAGDYAPSIGHIYGRPTIARLPDKEWYIVAGNGYQSGQGAKLVLINIATGSIDYIVAAVAAGPSDNNGLSAPALVSSTNSFTESNFAYAGDLNGNLYRFDLKEKTSTVLFSAGPTKPITVEPDIARHPTSVGVMVYFGTGQLLTAEDVSNLDTQSFYGIWDETFTSSEIDPEKLLKQTLVTRTGTWDESTKTVRVLLDSKYPFWDGPNKNTGWQVDLPEPGERLLGRPQVRANRIQFITTNPTSDFNNMEPGDGSWFNQLSLASGGSLSPPAPLYDLDRSGALDAGDAWQEPAPIGTLYPLGLNLGAGNIAQPAFASVTTDIDAVFINALLLPSPTPSNPGSAGGTLDVTTDSPSGPLVNPHDPAHPKYAEYGYGDTYPDYGDVP
jgi:Tfp pilus tip-associated adhesin PilY1